MSKRKPPSAELNGRRFGRLTVLGPGPRWGLWRTRCTCGREQLIRGSDFARGRRSCGCLRGIGALTHGATRRRRPTREYRSWCAMRARCHRDQYGYRQRGIKLCARWNSFANFLSDMGPMPTGARYTIERVKNHLGYSPSNCCWATYKEQSRNKRNNHLITYKRKTQTLAAWAEEYRLSYGTLKIRLRLGWPIKIALTTPTPAPHRVDPATGKFSRGRGTVRQSYKRRS